MATLGGLTFPEAMRIAMRFGDMVTRAQWLMSGVDRVYARSKLDGKIVRYERGFGAVYELTEEDKSANDWQTL